MQTLHAKDIDWWLIANPAAMGGQAKEGFDHIKHLFTSHDWSIEWNTSEFAGQAVDLAAEGYAKGYRHFLALGGDGTAHELINGLASAAPDWKRVHLALLPAGTGNDWIKNWNIPRAPEEWIHRMSTMHTTKIYPAEMSFTADDGTVKNRYFFNALSAGFGGEVMYRLNRSDHRKPHWIPSTFVHTVNAVTGGLSGGLIPPLPQPGKRSRWSYFATLIKTLFAHRSSRVLIKTDDREAERTIYTLEVCKGEYLGGGMHLAPHAKPHSPVLAVTEAVDLNSIQVMLNLPMLYNGTLCQHRNINCYEARSIEILPLDEDILRIEADGEYLGRAPVKIRTCTKYINYLHP